MQELTTSDQDHHSDELFYSNVVYLNTISDDITTYNYMECTGDNKQNTLLFKVDTCAQVTAITESV